MRSLQLLPLAAALLPYTALAQDGGVPEGDAYVSDTICHDGSCYPRVFEATNDFQVVQHDQQLPDNVHVRLNNDGLREARLAASFIPDSSDSDSDTPPVLPPADESPSGSQLFDSALPVISTYSKHNNPTLELYLRILETEIKKSPTKLGEMLISSTPALKGIIAINSANAQAELRKRAASLLRLCLFENPGALKAAAKQDQVDIIAHLLDSLKREIHDGAKLAEVRALGAAMKMEDAAKPFNDAKGTEVLTRLLEGKGPEFRKPASIKVAAEVAQLFEFVFLDAESGLKYSILPRGEEQRVLLPEEMKNKDSVPFEKKLLSLHEHVIEWTLWWWRPAFEAAIVALQERRAQTGKVGGADVVAAEDKVFHVLLRLAWLRSELPYTKNLKLAEKEAEVPQISELKMAFRKAVFDVCDGPESVKNNRMRNMFAKAYWRKMVWLECKNPKKMMEWLVKPIPKGKKSSQEPGMDQARLEEEEKGEVVEEQVDTKWASGMEEPV